MVQTSDVINEEPLGSSPILGCEERREKKLLQETADLWAQIEDDSISAEINSKELMGKQEEISIFALLKAVAALLQPERNRKVSQPGPSSTAGRGILRSALVAGFVDANAVTQKGEDARASYVRGQNRTAAVEMGYKQSLTQRWSKVQWHRNTFPAPPTHLKVAGMFL